MLRNKCPPIRLLFSNTIRCLAHRLCQSCVRIHFLHTPIRLFYLLNPTILAKSTARTTTTILQRHFTLVINCAFQSPNFSSIKQKIFEVYHISTQHASKIHILYLGNLFQKCWRGFITRYIRTWRRIILCKVLVYLMHNLRRKDKLNFTRETGLHLSALVACKKRANPYNKLTRNNYFII